MRIGIDARLPTYQMGGISQYVLQLLPALAQQDKDNAYVIFHSRKETGSFLPAGARNFQRQILWTPCHHRFERWTLALELSRHDLDVFHSPDFIPPAAGARRRVITIHDLNFLFYPQFLTAESRRYYLEQVRWAVEEADHIAVDSHATRRDVIEQLHAEPERVTTIHLAANPLYERPVSAAAVRDTLSRYDLPEGFVLFVGTLEPRKNLPMLLQAYELLRREWKVDAPLVLVGSRGWIYEEIFDTIKNLALMAYVRHLNGLTNEELAHLYHTAGLLVTPSHYEGFGLPALEAQLCGCPVIVSDRGSLPEIVGEHGIKLPPDDVELWAEQVYRVLSSSALRRQMIEYGHRQAQKFSWQKTAQATLALYQGRRLAENET